MVKIPNLLDMLKAGVHFGHATSKWHPKMKSFLFGSRNGVHIIDLEKSQEEMSKTLKAVRELAASGQIILFVGTKHQAREIVKQAAVECQMPYLTERWIGGLLTNFSEVKTRLKKYCELNEMFNSGEIEKFTKKEQVMLKKKLEKMDKYLIGLEKLEAMPDVLYIADMRIEKTAIKEAQKMNIKVVAVTDSNVNPEKANYIIPANDDAVNSIKMMANLISEAVNEGRMEWEKKQVEIQKQIKPMETKKVIPRKAVKVIQE